MKKLILSLIVCAGFPISAKRFTFKNKTPRSITILVTQDKRTETATALPDESVMIPENSAPEFDADSIDRLQLITTEKSVARPKSDIADLYLNRDMIYISRKPEKRELYVPEEISGDSTLGHVITTTKAYRQKNLKDKTNFSISKGFGIKGYFQVDALD